MYIIKEKFSALEKAILEYTNMKSNPKPLLQLAKTKEFNFFKKNTQEVLKKIKNSDYIIGYRGQGDFNIDVSYINDINILPLSGVVSFSEKSISKDYRNAPVKFKIKIPLEFIFIHYEVNPEFFPLKSENEFIVVNPIVKNYKNTNIDSNHDNGRKFINGFITGEVIGIK